MSSKLIIEQKEKKEEELKPLLQSSASLVSSKEEEPKSLKERIKSVFSRQKKLFAREFQVTGKEVEIRERTFPPNVICNQKYNAFTFLPFTIYEQFKSFINFYYLVLTLSQFIPVLKVGPVFTYAAPLAFVVGLSISMEAYLDIRRMLRDKQVNSEQYLRLTPHGLSPIPSSDIKVGHFIQIRTNQRIPADMILIRTTSEVGASFIRTDQLDGETDWKLRRAVQYTQKLESDADLFHLRDCSLYAEKPRRDIYDFIGTFSTKSEGTEPLNLENTLWSGTVLASDTVIGLVVYTGSDTRSALNTSAPATKKGKTAKEINFLTLLLCGIQLILGMVLVALGEFKGIWWLNYFRFLVLISAMIPISMSVNMDIAKFVYAWLIAVDNDIAGCTVRNTTIPEELGRISYLLSDKTGTLTQNEMEFRKLNLGSVNFSNETIEEIKEILLASYELKPISKSKKKASAGVEGNVLDAISALALCHNVTPVKENEEDLIPISYQASSPDEVALVKFSEKVGLILSNRSFSSISLTNPLHQTEEYEILESFPFSSERKRMGIILRNKQTGKIRFMMKGADTIMMNIVEESDWLEEECGNLAREGLRTLVIGHRYLDEHEWLDFKHRYHEAKSSIEDRDGKVARTIESIEKGLQLIGLTGVEDKLQEEVKKTLEMLRNAGIKIWMLTGDKRETATCIAISSKLVARTHSIYQMEIREEDEQSAIKQLNQFREMNEAVLVVDGASLQYLLDHHRLSFFEASKRAPSVVCCRCSPTQKAEVVKMIKEYSGLQTAAIGDGGNDVSMIQAAHIGIGIVGKEGKQASLASDYSINQFSHVGKLFLYHGRNSYLNSARMSQFIIHRGTIMALLQTLYSVIFYFSPIVLYTGGLVMGYSCWYTMCPVFALCINADVSEVSAMLYPELYQELRKGRALNKKTFFAMILVSLFQAFLIIFLGLFMGLDYKDFSALTFTVLCFVLLLNIVYIITIWHTLILLSVIVTFALYPIFIILQPMYYYLEYTATWGFWVRVMWMTITVSAPVGLIRYFAHKLNPPLHYKVSEIN